MEHRSETSSTRLSANSQQLEGLSTACWEWIIILFLAKQLFWTCRQSHLLGTNHFEPMPLCCANTYGIATKTLIPEQHQPISHEH